MLPAVLLATLALFVVSLGYGVVVPLLPDLAGGRAATDEALLSAVYASYAATKIATQVPGGVWVDRAGPERPLRLALVAYVVSLSGFLVGSDLVWFSVVRAVEGAATGLIYPAAFALALRGADPAHAGRRLGTMVGLGTAGMLVGPALGGWLGVDDPRRPVWVALALTMPVLAWALLRRPAPAPAPRAGTVGDEVRRLAHVARDLAFVGVALPIAFNKLTFSSFQGLLPLYGPDHLGVGARGVTALFVLTGVAFAGAQPVGGWLADRMGPRRVIGAATLPLLGGLALQRAADGPWAFAAAYGLYVASASLVFAATLKHVTVAFGAKDTYGGLFGMVGTLTDLMTVIGPLLFLNLYAAVGENIGPWMAACGVPFVLGWARWSGRRPRVHEP